MIVGWGWTDTEVAAVEVPQAFSPVTVYEVVAVGVMATPLLTPPVHVYVTAPLAVKVVDLPGHTPPVALLFTIARVGIPCITETVTTAAELQPAVVVPVTENAVVDVGPTTRLVLEDPVFQVWLEAPAALSVTEEPVQITGCDGVIRIPGYTVTGTVFVLMHPDPPPCTV